MMVRPERPDDIAAVRHVNEVAFGTADEADLVDRLRESAPTYLAFVAVERGRVVGHIAFSAVTIVPMRSEMLAFGLAPMAVLPSHQRRGVGSMLVREGIEACRRAGGDAVFVLGHARYYPRFGFEPASVHGIGNEFDAPAEAFMVLELTPDALRDAQGMVVYDSAFKP